MSVPSDDSLSEVLIDDLRLAWRANYGTDYVYMEVKSFEFDIASRWSFPKIVYLFIRYYGLANLATSNSLQVWITPFSCRHYLSLVTLGGPLVFSALSNVILMLRVHALYNGGRGVALLYTGIRINNTLVVSLLPGVPWPGCIMSNLHASYVLVGWVPDLITPTILFLLTMWNLIHSVLSPRGWRVIFQRNLPHAVRIPPLITAFFRDGTVHYLVWMITSFSFATSRLVLNLRVAAARLQGSTTTWHQTFSVRMPDMATYDDESDQRVTEENTIELHSFA
ncbi:hypothetical protein F5887DRAFT_950244 [Amanita rubescens]|nr:hypothetical protein F5887DRAFT_950244 [Amanita rubescens]